MNHHFVLRSPLLSLALPLLALSLQAQSPAPPAEGTLTAFTDRNAKDVPTQVNRLTQEVFMLKTELNVLTFRQEYGDRIRMERVYFPANTADRESIPGYVFTPKPLPSGKKHPALVFVHGGNHIQLTHEWFPWIAAALARGYVVIYPEYRGSSGHDEIIYENNYGVTDLADVLASAAYVSKKDYVDGTRLGIFGHSRGGMITKRALQVEPTRFKAGVDVAGLADLVAFMGYKSEARRQDIAGQKNFGGKLPDKNLPAYVDVSPAFHAEKMQAPLLLLNTTGDKTVPFQLHNKRMIESLKAHGKPHEHHLYQNAPGGHEFLFADTDEARDCQKRTFEWFAKHLGP